MKDEYPYPKLDEDGYEFEVVEQDGSPGHPFLPCPIPPDDKRFAVKPGDVVKLIFQYRDHVAKDGHTITAEHMWVVVADYGNGCLIGTLDNEPQYSKLLKSGDKIRFHPKHIVRFWGDGT